MTNNQTGGEAAVMTDSKIIDLAGGYSHMVGTKRVFGSYGLLVKFARALLASNQPVQAAPVVPSDEQMLRVFNSAESVIDVLHEIRALFTTTANADKESK